MSDDSSEVSSSAWVCLCRGGDAGRPSGEPGARKSYRQDSYAQATPATLSLHAQPPAGIDAQHRCGQVNSLTLRRSAGQIQQFDPGCLTTNHHYNYSLTTRAANGSRVLDRGDFTTQSVPRAARRGVAEVKVHRLSVISPVSVIASGDLDCLSARLLGGRLVDAQLSLGIDTPTWRAPSATPMQKRVARSCTRLCGIKLPCGRPSDPHQLADS